MYESKTLRTSLRIQTVPHVGISMGSILGISGIPYTKPPRREGRPMGNLSHDQSCKNSGQPRRAEPDAVSVHALHIARYVPAKSAEPQLLCVMSSADVAFAISCAIRINLLETMLPCDSANITFPRSHNMYAYKLLVICGSLIG